jgi:hypothetical protein
MNFVRYVHCYESSGADIPSLRVRWHQKIKRSAYMRSTACEFLRLTRYAFKPELKLTMVAES